MSSPDRILVTGGGGRLAKALARCGALAPSRTELDIVAPHSVSAALDADEPVAVINAAAYTNVEQAETDRDIAFAVNGSGAGIVAATCAARNIPLVHISTDYVFGDADRSAPVDETMMTDPLSVYGESKLAGESAVAEAGCVSVIARVSWLFDDGANTFIDKMLKIASSRDRMMIVDDAWGRPTSVSDLAPLLIKLAMRLADDETLPPILHMGPPEPASRYDWASEIFATSRDSGGPCPAIERCTSDDMPTKVRHPRNLVLDTSEAYKLLGPVPNWREATRRAVKQRLKETGGG
ncbi:MAG: sugar nucleotide-binding protein [Pseudomonadota bacterium]